MSFPELKKRKYKKADVETMLLGMKSEYEEQLALLKDKSDSLAKENADLKANLEKLRRKDGVIGKAIKRAEETAEEIENRAKTKYDLEIRQLKRFLKKRRAVFDNAAKSGLSSAEAAEFARLSEQINAVFDGGTDAVSSVKKACGLLNEEAAATQFNPKEKIKKYIENTEKTEERFNIDDVLNPGRLDLEDLCRELGLMKTE